MCDFQHTAEPPCKCRRAVMNGYHGMKESGAAESEAMDAACRIYRFHHPEAAIAASRLTVEQWIYARHTH